MKNTHSPVCGPMGFSIDSLGFQYTRQCNLACDHCCVESSPAVKGKLAQDIVADRIDEAARLGIGTIGFTGGEPMLFSDEIVWLVEKVCHNKQKAVLVTNASWATSARITAEVVCSLKKAGLDQMDISYDEFHKKAGARIEWVGWAVSECRRQDIRVRVRRQRHTVQTKAGIEVAKEILRLRCNDKVGVLYPYGRAREKLPKGKTRYCVSPLRKVPMCDEIGKLLYMWDGALVPCCNGVYSIKDGQNGALDNLAMGNIYEHSLEESIERFRRNLFLAVLGTCGPGGFIILSRDNGNSISWPKEVECACEFCIWAANDERFQRWFRTLEKDHYAILQRLEKFRDVLDRWGLSRCTVLQ